MGESIHRCHRVLEGLRVGVKIRGGVRGSVAGSSHLRSMVDASGG